MRHRVVLRRLTGPVLVMLSLLACAVPTALPTPTPTHTAVPSATPTPTPTPTPTRTPTPEPTADGGRVEGRIYRSDTDQPVGLVDVALRTADGAEVAVTTADADGYYAFQGVEPGTYLVYIALTFEHPTIEDCESVVLPLGWSPEFTIRNRQPRLSGALGPEFSISGRETVQMDHGVACEG